MKVAIIGAGVAGLFALKSCLEEGLEPTCLEKTDQIGGLWVYREAHKLGYPTGVYAGLRFNTSVFSHEASDFPSHVPNLLPTAEQHLNYLQEYARHFDLEKYILFNSEVVSVQPKEDLWEVTWYQNGVENEPQIFDAVLVCSGRYSIPIAPEIDGREMFKGTFVTSQEYKNNRQDFVKNKRVLVIGNSISAGDLSAVAAPATKQLYISIGRGCSLIGVLFKGLPFDTLASCRATRLASANPRRTRQMVEMNKNLTFPEQEEYGITTYGQNIMTRPFLVSANDIPSLVREGRIKIKPKLVRLDETKAHFDNGKSIEIDTVITCTGYDVNLSFLSEDIVANNVEDMDLYRLMWPLTTKKPNLAFIGVVRIFGSFTPYLELEARYAVQVIQGKCHLPNHDVMEKEIKERKDFLKKTFGKTQARFHKPLLEYQDHMAEEIGCLPQWRDYLPLNPVMALVTGLGPAFPCTYRLVGPHASPGAERRARELFWRWARLLPLREGVMGLAGALVRVGLVAVVLYFLVQKRDMLWSWIGN